MKEKGVPHKAERPSVCRKTSTGSKGFALWRVEGTQYPPNIAPPLGEGLGWGQLQDAQP